MSSVIFLNCAKFWRITTSAYIGARDTATIKCKRENSSNTLTWTRRTSSRDGCEWRYIEGQCFFGGIICRQTKACFLRIVGQNDRDTLLLIIRTHISPGTRVMSDMPKPYDCLKDEGYTHLTVNQNLNFIDPDTGAPTQRNENTWWGVKRSVPGTGTSKDPSKAIYRNGCGVSTMETILLPAKHYQAYRRLICVNIVRRSYHCMHCSWCDRHFMEERNKIHSFNTWDCIKRKKRQKTGWR